MCLKCSFDFIQKILLNKYSKQLIINYVLGDTDLKLFKIFDNKFFLNYSLGYKENEKTVVNIENEEEKEDLDSGDYMEDPDYKEILSPLIYVYNTHQTEEYEKAYLEPYNIKPTVMLTSYMLREKMNELGIETMVETQEIKKVLNKNGWKYGQSYKVSRIFMEEAKNLYPTLKVFIDIHRDSGSHKNTTVECNMKNHARVLFVVGLEHDNYEKNLNNANSLNDKLINKCNNLSRGIMKKSGSGVNGIYNQDFDENTFLIEVGGQYNSIDEVKNTVDLLSDIIFEYVKEKYGD